MERRKCPLEVTAFCTASCSSHEAHAKRCASRHIAVFRWRRKCSRLASAETDAAFGKQVSIKLKHACWLASRSTRSRQKLGVTGWLPSASSLCAADESRASNDAELTGGSHIVWMGRQGTATPQRLAKQIWWASTRSASCRPGCLRARCLSRKWSERNLLPHTLQRQCAAATRSFARSCPERTSLAGVRGHDGEREWPRAVAGSHRRRLRLARAWVEPVRSHDRSSVEMGDDMVTTDSK